MGQIHSWAIAVSDIASAFLNTPVDPSKSPIFVQASRELQYLEPTVSSQTSIVWPQRCSKIMASSFLTDHGQKGNDSSEVRFTRLPQERSEWSRSIGSLGIRR